MKCQYCDRTVTDDNSAGLCAFHLDLEVLVECLQDNSQPVTLEALTGLIKLGLSRGGSFEIAPGDLPELITPALAEKYGVELNGAIPFRGEPRLNREITQKDYVGL